MLKREIVPDFSECIETRAKKEFNQAVERLVAAGRDEVLEEKIETLRLFLENMDLRKLRAESERHLLEGKRVTFVIYREGDSPKYDMQVE